MNVFLVNLEMCQQSFFKSKSSYPNQIKQNAIYIALTVKHDTRIGGLEYVVDLLIGTVAGVQNGVLLFITSVCVAKIRVSVFNKQGSDLQ